MTTGIKCSRCGEFESVHAGFHQGSLEEQVEKLSLEIHDPHTTAQLCEVCREELQTWLDAEE
jgi:hypothetical protein